MTHPRLASSSMTARNALASETIFIDNLYNRDCELSMSDRGITFEVTGRRSAKPGGNPKAQLLGGPVDREVSHRVEWHAAIPR